MPHPPPPRQYYYYDDDDPAVVDASSSVSLQLTRSSSSSAHLELLHAFKLKRTSVVVVRVQRAWRSALKHRLIRKHASDLMLSGVGVLETDLKSRR
jgi:hypothetical protein